MYMTYSSPTQAVNAGRISDIPTTITGTLHGLSSSSTDSSSAGSSCMSDSAWNEPICRFISNLPPGEVHQRAIAAGKMLGRAHKALASWLIEINDRKLYKEFACSSIYHYGARFLMLAGHTVAEYLRTGRKLAELPLLSDAYEKGEISATHVREITRVATVETEGFWHEAARNSTTREIEKMVAFTPSGGLPPMNSETEASLPGLFHQKVTAGHNSTGDAHSTNGGTPRQQLKYHDRLTIDLEAEEMAVLHDAFKKARKECGKSDRSSLLLYMARAFLQDPAPDGTVKKGRKPPYQVVYHHHLSSGLSWCETTKGERPLPPQALAKALCDADVRDAGEILTAGELTAGGELTIPGESTCKCEENKGSFSNAGHKAYTPADTNQSLVFTENISHSPDPAGDGGRSPYPAGDAHHVMDHGRAMSHLAEPMGKPEAVKKAGDVDRKRAIEYINELYREMKGKKVIASPGSKSAQQKARPTISRTLRKRVLERDGHRCQVPGCGRDRFTVIHHLDPVALGGKDEAHKLVTVCWYCHDMLHEGTLTVHGHAPHNLLWGEGKTDAAGI